jgi:hypothetical protein
VPVSEPWWRHDPARLEADVAEIEALFPDLDPLPELGAGAGWVGRLPIWPFDRVAPLVFPDNVVGLGIVLLIPPSYPMALPQVMPVDPKPEFMERTQHRWHVNGDGSLCMVQEQRNWTGREKITDLLKKAAGWRLEYDLVRAGVFPAMSLAGIVTDPSRDESIAYHYTAAPS